MAHRRRHGRFTQCRDSHTRRCQHSPPPSASSAAPARAGREGRLAAQTEGTTRVFRAVCDHHGQSTGADERPGWQWRSSHAVTRQSEEPPPPWCSDGASMSRTSRARPGQPRRRQRRRQAARVDLVGHGRPQRCTAPAVWYCNGNCVVTFFRWGVVWVWVTLVGSRGGRAGRSVGSVGGRFGRAEPRGRVRPFNSSPRRNVSPFARWSERVNGTDPSVANTSRRLPQAPYPAVCCPFARLAASRQQFHAAQHRVGCR